MATIKTEKIRLEDIREYENNPRNNKKAIKPVINSIRKFGYVNPIIIDEEGVILAGHTRLKALQEIGAEEAEIIRLTHLTDEEKRSYRIADNRTHEYSSWNENLLEAEIRSISADDWAEFGFKGKEIQRFKPAEMCTCPKCGRKFTRV